MGSEDRWFRIVSAGALAGALVLACGGKSSQSSSEHESSTAGSGGVSSTTGGTTSSGGDGGSAGTPGGSAGDGANGGAGGTPAEYQACPAVDANPPAPGPSSRNDQGALGLATLRARVLESREVWRRYATLHGNSYRYVREYHNYFGSFCEGTIEVENGTVTRRTQWLGPDTWSEVGTEVGMHEGGCYPAVTMDALYDQCLNEVLCKSPAENFIYVNVDARGLLVQCGYFPMACADDCYQGIGPLILTADGTDWTEPLPGCCEISAEPDCCMSYGGAGDVCGMACDGMPWPGPAWQVSIDPQGCFRWVEPNDAVGCCGCSLPDGGQGSP